MERGYVSHTHVYGDADGLACIELPRRKTPVPRSLRPRRKPYGSRVGWTLYLFHMRCINREVPDWDWDRRRDRYDRLTRGDNRKWKVAGWAA